MGILIVLFTSALEGLLRGEHDSYYYVFYREYTKSVSLCSLFKLFSRPGAPLPHSRQNIPQGV